MRSLLELTQVYLVKVVNRLTWKTKEQAHEVVVEAVVLDIGAVLHDQHSQPGIVHELMNGGTDGQSCNRIDLHVPDGMNRVTDKKRRI
jgi:hypothetical protein